MSMENQASLTLIVYVAGNLAIVYIIYFVIKSFISFISPSFTCTGKVINKSSEVKSYSDVRGSTSYFNAYYITFETLSMKTYTYSVDLEKYSFIEEDKTYKFFVKSNAIKEYEFLME